MTTKNGTRYLEENFGPLTLADLLFIEREDAELSQVNMAKSSVSVNRNYAITKKVEDSLRQRWWLPGQKN